MAGDRGASRAQGGLDCRFGAGNGEERTWNMRYMFVTLDVSKASGWLNADAPCRESNGGHMRCGAGEGAGQQAGATASSPECSGGSMQIGDRTGVERTLNIWFMVVTLDVSKLSGWLNALAYCRVERRAYDAERGVGHGRRESVGRQQRTSGRHGERARL